MFNDELDPKDVAHESNPIRLKLARARGLVAALPAVDKTIEQQHAEIAALQQHIAQQRAMIKQIGDMAVVQQAVADSSGRGRKHEVEEQEDEEGGEKMDVDC